MTRTTLSGSPSLTPSLFPLTNFHTRKRLEQRQTRPSSPNRPTNPVTHTLSPLPNPREPSGLKELLHLWTDRHPNNLPKNTGRPARCALSSTISQSKEGSLFHVPGTLPSFFLPTSLCVPPQQILETSQAHPGCLGKITTM